MTARSIISATLSRALIDEHLQDACRFDRVEHQGSIPVRYGDFLKLHERPTT